MKTSLAIVVCAVAAVLMMFAPSKASAGGRYYSDGYGYAYGYCCPSHSSPLSAICASSPSASSLAAVSPCF